MSRGSKGKRRSPSRNQVPRKERLTSEPTKPMRLAPVFTTLATWLTSASFWSIRNAVIGGVLVAACGGAVGVTLQVWTATSSLDGADALVAVDRLDEARPIYDRIRYAGPLLSSNQQYRANMGSAFCRVRMRVVTPGAVTDERAIQGAIPCYKAAVLASRGPGGAVLQAAAESSLADCYLELSRIRQREANLQLAADVLSGAKSVNPNGPHSPLAPGRDARFQAVFREVVAGDVEVKLGRLRKDAALIALGMDHLQSAASLARPNSPSDDPSMNYRIHLGLADGYKALCVTNPDPQYLERAAAETEIALESVDLENGQTAVFEGLRSLARIYTGLGNMRHTATDYQRALASLTKARAIAGDQTADSAIVDQTMADALIGLYTVSPSRASLDEAIQLLARSSEQIRPQDAPVVFAMIHTSWANALVLLALEEKKASRLDEAETHLDQSALCTDATVAGAIAATRQEILAVRQDPSRQLH